MAWANLDLWISPRQVYYSITIQTTNLRVFAVFATAASYTAVLFPHKALVVLTTLAKFVLLDLVRFVSQQITIWSTSLVCVCSLETMT